MEQLKLSDERYEEIKLKVLETFKNYNISCVPVSGFEIVTKMGIKINMYSSLSYEKLVASLKFSNDGFSLYDKGKWTIFLNDIDNGYRRQNNTLLHEVGHIVLDHTEDSELADKEANFFAKYALVPPVLVYKLNIKSVKQIEDIFEVSHQAAKYALDYYCKWYNFSGRIKPYEIELANLFGYDVGTLEVSYNQK
ncbi:MAG: ImmA/IrrE family metallo-endopeptidase [Bacilli bacterium]|nr:ImmA/IrrE family metallo-endopeptidase [Bacilli bacterium]